MKPDPLFARWRSEKTAAYLCAAVAEAERSIAGKKLFNDMAGAAEEQAGIIAAKMQAKPAFRPSLRSRLINRMIKTVGPRRMRAILAATKVRGVSFYSGPVLRSGRPMWRRSANAIAAAPGPCVRRCLASMTVLFPTLRW